MNRAFVSLYFVIVLSVIAIGWVTERVWIAYSNDDSANDTISAREDLIHALFAQLDQVHSPDLQHYLNTLSEHMSVRLTALPWEDFAESDIKTSLGNGEIVVVNRNQEERRYYALSPNQEWVLLLVEVQHPTNDSWAYRFLLVGFYLFVAIAVYFWVLPLTRDLKHLQRRAEKVGRDGETEPFSLKPSSAVYGLAQTFNSMSARIRQLLASQKEMTHGISHELRTPLARMKFTLASLEKDAVHEVEWQSIDENIRELETLISRFLNYASYESTNINVSYQEGELMPMIQRVIDHGHFSTSVAVNNSLQSGRVRCDWDLIEHCVKNLLQNADRYGCDTILVELDECAETYAIRVHDNGLGVAKEDKERIFDAFYRSPNQGFRSNSERGFGLGLALVKRIITWHYGSISVKESPLGGACFSLVWAKDPRCHSVVN